MIILRTKTFSDQEMDIEREMKNSDKRAIKNYKKNKNIRNIIKDQYSEDPEVRKEANKKDMIIRYKRLPWAAAGFAAGDIGAYGLSRVPIIEKHTGKMTKGELLTNVKSHALGGAIGIPIATGIVALQNKKRGQRVDEDTLNDKDKRKLDQIKVSEGNMTEEEFTKKWGKIKNK